MAALLDAQALIAFLVGEAGGRRVREVLRAQDSATSAINLDEAQVRDLLEPLGVRILAVDASLAWRAAALRFRHYGRRTSRVSLADCCLVAAASSTDSVVSGDRGVVAMARAEGLQVVEI
jgi:PIN domain nuclease of toxin-antitoxin system